MSNEEWQQHTQLEYVTEVSYSLSILLLLNLVTSEEFIHGLLVQCAISCCPLSISIHKNVTGVVTVTARTTLPREKVFALIANLKQVNQGFIVTAATAPLPETMNINVAMQTPWNSLASYGN